MIPAVIVADPPAEWRPAEVTPPRIAESAGAELASWRASRDPMSETTLVTGCVATPVPGWVDDMRPSVEARTVALAGAVAEKITGRPIDARPDGNMSSLLHLRSAADLDRDPPPIGAARALVGFDERRVFTCFATCVARGSEETVSRCADLARQARLVGSQAPPSPGIALRAVTWAVHHPRPAAFGFAVAAAAAFVTAVAARRRPRSGSALRVR
jgi:hypothetical protein